MNALATRKPPAAYLITTPTIKVYGNEAQGLNDCVKGNPGRLNAVAIHVMYRGWPYVFMMTDEDVQAGGELFISYGERFWDKEDLLAGMFGVVVGWNVRGRCVSLVVPLSLLFVGGFSLANCRRYS